MLRPVAVFLLLVSSDAVMVEKHTFEYENPNTGDTLLCSFCPPGTYMSSPCTRTLDTECLPCPEEHFTQFWNFLPKCLYCSNICEGNRVVKRQCSATHDRECKCKEGYYSEDGYCLPHSQCPPGQGAKIIGNTQRDTQCETCPSGTFSAQTSSSAQCVKHMDCGTLDVLIPGKKWHDNICSSCANLTNEGELNVLRDILPRFFSHREHKLRHLRTFVQMLRVKNGRRGIRSLKSREELLVYITEWTKHAHTQQLKALPETIQRSGLHWAARKVQKLLARIAEKVSVCRYGIGQIYY